MSDQTGGSLRPFRWRRDGLAKVITASIKTDTHKSRSTGNTIWRATFLVENMEQVEKRINEIFQETVQLHGEDSPVCTICAEEMFRSIHKQYQDDGRFTEKGKVTCINVDEQTTVTVKVAMCAYVFDPPSLTDDMMAFLAKRMMRSWNTVVCFCSVNEIYLMRCDDGLYKYKESTPRHNRRFGPLHNVLLVKYKNNLMAYDASYKQFTTAIGAQPAFLVLDKTFP